MRGFLGGLVLMAGSVVTAAHAAEPAAAVRVLVEKFTAAQGKFDVGQLSALTAEDYIEISPLGEVDPRAKMLGYYAPEHKVDAPPVTISETDVRVHGDTALEIAKISYAMPGPDGQTHAVEMRVVFVARKAGSEWKLESAQYTGIRAPKVAAAK